MKITSKFAFLAAAAILLVLHGEIHAKGADEATKAARTAIDAGNKKFMEGIAKRDAALIASAYTEDAVAFPAHSDAVKGKQDIQKMWQSVLDSGVSAFELATAEVEADGNLAYEAGTYSMTAKDGTVLDRGKYCVVWKRVNGQWLLHRDIWTTSLPATAK